MSALTDRAEYQTADNHRVIACECRGWDEWCECHPGARFIVRQNHAHTCQRHPHQDDRHIANATEAVRGVHVAGEPDRTPEDWPRRVPERLAVGRPDRAWGCSMSDHQCPWIGGLTTCPDHPKWHVRRGRYYWLVYAPNGVMHEAWFRTWREAFDYAYTHATGAAQ